MIRTFTNDEILQLRPARNDVDANRAYAAIVEQERNASGETVDIATLFLTNSECPFRCLMCDLWKNTTERSEPSVDVPLQIRTALSELPVAREIKLYNSGNFFDTKAVSPQHYDAIADLVREYDTVIVENHPTFCGDRCLTFRDAISPAQLEIAIGLETAHPELLQSLNKGMTLDDYEKAVRFLLSESIRLRTFILLKPPFQNEEEGVEWALKSIRFAFDLGVHCCSLVPTRTGNGIMERLQSQGNFTPPRGESMELVLEEGIRMKRGRVFMDLWDAERFFSCEGCRNDRIQRLQKMNLSQIVLPSVSCVDCGT